MTVGYPALTRSKFDPQQVGIAVITRGAHQFGSAARNISSLGCIASPFATLFVIGVEMATDDWGAVRSRRSAFAASQPPLAGAPKQPELHRKHCCVGQRRMHSQAWQAGKQQNVVTAGHEA